MFLLLNVYNCKCWRCSGKSGFTRVMQSPPSITTKLMRETQHLFTEWAHGLLYNSTPGIRDSEVAAAIQVQQNRIKISLSSIETIMHVNTKCHRRTHTHTQSILCHLGWHVQPRVRSSIIEQRAEARLFGNILDAHYIKNKTRDP